MAAPMMSAEWAMSNWSAMKAPDEMPEPTLAPDRPDSRQAAPPEAGAKSSMSGSGRAFASRIPQGPLMTGALPFSALDLAV
jgi:hypothetical protein